PFWPHHRRFCRAIETKVLGYADRDALAAASSRWPNASWHGTRKSAPLAPPVAWIVQNNFLRKFPASKSPSLKRFLAKTDHVSALTDRAPTASSSRFHGLCRMSTPRRYPERVAKSAWLSFSVAAATFSSRCGRWLVPGIGSMTGLRRRTQASATCDGA